MKIILDAQRSTEETNNLPPVIDGDRLTYEGLSYNFEPLLEGAEIEIGFPFTEPVKRVNGVIEVSLQYFYSTATAELNQSSNLQDYTFEIESGLCPCPIKRKSTEAVNEPAPIS